MSEPSPRLVELEGRWSSDRTSRLFLQLAEEYRRHGRLDDAVTVLREGLAAHPGYLSARVSLARCLLETSEPHEAQEILEAALAQDPTHLVVTKLLVETCLALEDRAGAERALERLRLLTPADDEVADLERRARALARTAAASTPPAPAPGTDGETPSPVEGAAAPPPPEAAPAARPAPYRIPPSPHPGPDLLRGNGDGRALRCAATAPFDLRPASRGAAGPSILFALPVLAVPDEVPTPESVAEPRGGSSVPASPDEGTPMPEGWDQTTPARSPEGRVDPAAPELADATLEDDEADGGAAAELAAPADDASPPSPDGALRPSEAEQRPPGVSVTLGDLYLRQGHLEEAEGIYREVLRREPVHAAAAEGLAKVEAARRQRPLLAADLLGPDPPEGLTARRIHVLRGYLQVFRQREG